MSDETRGGLPAEASNIKDIIIGGMAALALVSAIGSLLVAMLIQPNYEHVARSVAFGIVKQELAGADQWTQDEVQAVAAKSAERAIAEAGLTGEALDNAMEDAIIAFIKSRATQDGQPANATGNQPQRPPQNIDVAAIDPATEPVAGNPDARYHLIVYSDYECPFCKRFWPTVQTVIEEYGDRLAITLRDYPLPFHGRAAMREAIAAQCAFNLGGDKAFWAYSDMIYAKTASNGQGISGDEPLVEMAKAVSIEGAMFKKCLSKADRVRQGIEADMASGTDAGVRGTPTSVLIDTRTGRSAVVRGAQPLSAMTSALDNLLGANQ